MKENTVVAFQNPSDFQKDPLTEVLQAGARELLAQAVEAEVSVFLGSHAALVDAAGRRRVVRNGYLPERFIQTGIGPVSVRQPRVRDRGDGAIRFTSAILPRYLRRAKSLEDLLPWLYDRELKDVFAVQSEVARQVAKALAVTLKANENERLFQKYTANTDAYDVFLQARRTVDAPTKDNI